MKKSLLAICTFILALIFVAFTFKNDPVFDNLLEEEYKLEFVSNSSSDLLITNLADVYSHEFDDVSKVDIHYNESDGYYFVAYGKKNDLAIARMISASDDMAAKEYYPSRSDMGFSSTEAVINCHCQWIFCLPGGQGKYCGIARDTMSPCHPSVLCAIKIDPIDID